MEQNKLIEKKELKEFFDIEKIAAEFFFKKNIVNCLAYRNLYTNIFHTKKLNTKMNLIKIFGLTFLTFIGCGKKVENENLVLEKNEKPTLEIITENFFEENLPKEIVFEGKIKEIKKIKDINGEHIILLTETGEMPSKKIINEDYETDFKIFAYDYLLDKKSNKYDLYWKIQDFITNCEFDLLMGFLNNTFKITDLNKNGIAEIWTMYSMTCTSDVSPSEMKIIMYEGKQKFALRGKSIVNSGIEKLGGDYNLDESFLNAPKEFKDFALKMWNENNKQKFE